MLQAEKRRKKPTIYNRIDGLGQACALPSGSMARTGERKVPKIVTVVLQLVMLNTRGTCPSAQMEAIATFKNHLKFNQIRVLMVGGLVMA